MTAQTPGPRPSALARFERRWRHDRIYRHLVLGWLLVAFFAMLGVLHVLGRLTAA